MREVKKCLVCGEEFVTYFKGKFCSTQHYVLYRHKHGWFRKDFKKTLNCMSKSRNKLKVGKYVPKGFD